MPAPPGGVSDKENPTRLNENDFVISLFFLWWHFKICLLVCFVMYNFYIKSQILKCHYKKEINLFTAELCNLDRPFSQSMVEISFLILTNQNWFSIRTIQNTFRHTRLRAVNSFLLHTRKKVFLTQKMECKNHLPYFFLNIFWMVQKTNPICVYLTLK